jgi:hypothetical protein
MASLIHGYPAASFYLTNSIRSFNVEEVLTFADNTYDSQLK